jgi:cytochrome c-type biogenesis protein CcmE
MKKKYIISSLLVFVVVIYLVFTGFKSEGVYYLNVDELLVKNISSNRDVKVSGIVEKDTIKRIDTEKRVYFNLIGENGGSVAVLYEGLVPSAFKEGVGAIVKGTYSRDRNLLIADVLLTKCPSKYEAKIEK